MKRTARTAIIVALAICAVLIATIILARSAQAMQIDVSRTWCARNGPAIDREHYYAWNAKCHARRGTKPRWKSSGEYWGTNK